MAGGADTRARWGGLPGLSRSPLQQERAGMRDERQASWMGGCGRDCAVVRHGVTFRWRQAQTSHALWLCCQAMQHV